MTELREIVAVEDRQKFDDLVYRRNEEMPRSRDPREHDYRHSRVSKTFLDTSLNHNPIKTSQSKFSSLLNFS